MKFEDYFKTKSSLNKQLSAPFLKERINFIDEKIASGVQSSNTIRFIAYVLLPIATMASDYKDYVPIHAIWKLAHPDSHQISKIRSYCLLEYSLPFLRNIHKLDPCYDDTSLIINKYLRRPHFRVKYLSAPNLDERENYLLYKFKRGTSLNTLAEIIPILLSVQDYLQLLPLRVVTFAEVTTAANRYAIEKGKSPNYAFIMFLRVAKDWLSYLDLLIYDNTLLDIHDMDKLWCYLNSMHDRGLSKKTIHLHKKQLVHFMRFITGKDEVLENLKPETIDEYFEYLSSNGVSRRTIYPLSSVIRVYLRFCEENKWCMTGISSFIKAPRMYHCETLPYPVPWDNVRILIQSVDTDNPTDIRNRAMFLLLAVYGLRSSEVTGLRLADIDWENEEFYLRRSKNSIPQKLPLFAIVGNAIVKYLRFVRNNEIKSDYVFLALKAPYNPLTGGAIYRFLSAQLKSQDLQLRHYGAHSLRYGCATHLINTGHTFKEVADLLGHKMLETTRIYAKVDMNNLSKVADMNWEGLL